MWWDTGPGRCPCVLLNLEVPERKAPNQITHHDWVLGTRAKGLESGGVRNILDFGKPLLAEAHLLSQ